ncbi:MAG: ATP-binding protein [Ferruginibacter sp.]
MNNIVVIIASLLYLMLLFGIAYYAEYRNKQGKSIINNAWVYALSLAVYCTAWTYYGSVGRASDQGIDFLAIYIGPTIMAAFFWPVLKKIIRISKAQRINSIADFISTRYGKNFTIAIVVTLFCVLGIIPYIALQIKAISGSFNSISNTVPTTGALKNTFTLFTDSAFYFTALLAFFIVLYGTRSVDATEKHEGLVAAIAFESVIKLVAFLIVGCFVTYGIFDGFGDIFSKISAHAEFQHLLTFKGSSSYLGWTAMIVLSMFAILLLPRQFQVQVVENVHEQHVKKAMWLFPLYLFCINIFVLPIAFAGKLIFAGQAMSADNYVLALPLHFDEPVLALITFIGGFSAATSMIIISTIALSIMLSNNLIMPLLLSLPRFRNAVDTSIRKTILYIRRISILVVLMLAYLYDKLIAEQLSLVSIGLVSFAAVIQFAPAIIGGIFWKQASKNGALWGIIAGFIFWFFTLVVPSMVSGGLLSKSLMDEGLLGIQWLRPFHIFDMQGMDYITHSMFWSLLANCFIFIVLSLHDKRSTREIYQAELFVDANRFYAMPDSSVAWKGTAYMPDLNALLANFLGQERSVAIINGYAKRNKINIEQSKIADPRLVAFSERVLSGVIGSASARIMVRSVTKEEEISIDEVLSILRENQQMIGLNKELRKKSQELSKATLELTRVNEQLKTMDELKDEFLYTVTHELRTPLTSIRALSEIVYDNPDLSDEERQQYLGAVITETERLSHLITQVLNLEKYESGRQKLNQHSINLGELIQEVVQAIQPLAKEKQLSIQLHLPDSMILLLCDKDLIRQVLYNLLSNAVKFAHHKIDIHALLNYDEWQIDVQDDGKGVPQESAELIFDKFFQAHHQTLKKPQGTGLGLAISRKIVEMHGGKIWVESEENKGAKFIFTLHA